MQRNETSEKLQEENCSENIFIAFLIIFYQLSSAESFLFAQVEIIKVLNMIVM